ncbi:MULTISPECIES: hypothetical protein [unclassified Haladaptatus]|uniref:DUF7504 family protein n=1 Tax=unclassified Haladaptatus TaxID=2622732 RepID=UPI0023E858FF|nr:MULTISPECIES: hypothetical protein [unclassified Haladaptatus]
MPSEGGTGLTETTAITQALAALKRRGSSILLVGSGCEEAHDHACKRLLGDDPAEDRRRLFVFTDSPIDVDRRLPSGNWGGDSVRVIDSTVLTRSAATTAQPGSISFPTTTVDEDDLAGLGRAISADMETFDMISDGLDAAQLRVCIDSLVPLLADHDEEDVFAFLHALAGELHRVGGMGHFHLPLSYDAEAVQLIEPLFDAVIETRCEGDVEYQRWHLQDGRLSTDWLAL